MKSGREVVIELTETGCKSLLIPYDIHQKLYPPFNMKQKQKQKSGKHHHEAKISNGKPCHHEVFDPVSHLRMGCTVAPWHRGERQAGQVGKV